MARREGAELIIRCREVADFTDKASSDNGLIKVLSDATQRVSIYAFKTRFKGATSILKKVQRKRKEGEALLPKISEEIAQERLTSGNKKTPKRLELEEKRREVENLISYDPDHVTDAWGCRFVTLYQSEIPVTVSALLEALSVFNETCPSAPVRLREFVIYTNRPDHDPLSIVAATQKVLERSNFADSTSVIRPPENRKSAYSSVHLVFDRDVEIEHAGKEREVELATFEIQVRDIFEEGWGEVQHHLLYSDKDGPLEPDPQEEDAALSWRLHLNALKTFVDGCSQHASIIRMHFDASKRGPTPTNVTTSVSERERDRTSVIQTLKRLNAPEAAREAILKGYALLETGEQPLVGEAPVQRLLEATDSFESALTNLTDRCKQEKVQSGLVRTVEYFLSMEQASALAGAADALEQSDDPLAEVVPLRVRAREIYREIAKKHRYDPIVHVRLGTVLEQLAASDRDLAEALSSIERGIKILENDPLGLRDHWLAISSHVKKSYILWLQATRQEERDSRLLLLSKAASASLDALKAWRSQTDVGRQAEINRLQAHKAASNVLYFAGTLVLEGCPSEIANEAVLREHIRLIERLNIDIYSDYFKTRDNLIFAYRALGEYGSAESLAMINFRELRRLAEQRCGLPLDISEVEKHLRGSEGRCFSTARRVLFEK